MTAADLREWVALFMPDLQPDGQGGYREAVPAGLEPDRPASVERPAGGQASAGDQLGDRIRHVVTIRYEPGLSTAYRVLWRDMYFDVVGLENVDQRNTWLALTIERREAGAQ